MLASFINPGGLIPKEFEASSAASETYSEKEDSDQNSLPTLLPELLTQSCLVPALSSYLRNDSGAVLSYYHAVKSCTSFSESLAYCLWLCLRFGPFVSSLAVFMVEIFCS